MVGVDEPKSYKHISIQFLGRAYVHWTERTDEHAREYTSYEVYIDVRQTLWTADQSSDGRLAQGQYSFPFRFDIPSNAPSSFEGTVGSNRYELHGRIGTGHLKFDHKLTVRVPVQQVVRISEPRLLQPTGQELTGGCLFCTSAPIVLTVTVPKTGYCIGETLPVQVSIENGSSNRITMTVTLYQRLVYKAQHCYRECKKTLVHVVSDRIAPHVTHEWVPTLKFPATEVLDERSCSIIQMSYYLNVTALILWGSNLSTKIPLNAVHVLEQAPPGQSTLPPKLQW